uniref:hypothetical protein n=1 Tax=Jeotgalibaca porci TaxID=1868793 RepID=UPI0035A14812
ESIQYVPDNFNIYSDFNTVYGFGPVYYITDGENPQEPVGNYVYLDWESTPIIPLDGADYLLKVNFYSEEEVTYPITEAVTLTLVDSTMLILEENSKEELLRFDLTDVIEKALAESDEVQKGAPAALTAMMETKENEQAKMTVIVTQLDKYEEEISGEVFIAITLK